MGNILVILLILLAGLGFSQTQESSSDENGNHFTGTISRLNPKARLARIRTDFKNIKFLSRKDRVEFWNETYPDNRCIAIVEGRTNDYLLLKISQYESCIRKVHFTTGSFLHFESPDLAQTVKVARELVQILLKKGLRCRPKKID